MARAKLTVSREQAERLGLLQPRQKYDPVNSVTFEPKSGVNLKFTPAGQVIPVSDTADISMLKLMYKQGYFTVAEGKIADVTTLLSISIAGDMLTVHFDQPVYITGGLLDTDFEVKVDGVAIEGLTVGAITKANAAKSFTFDIGDIPTAGDSVSLEIKTTGAAKIKDVGDVAIVAATKTTTA